MRYIYHEYIRANEGYRRYAYRCSAGKLTIGIGRNIDAGGPGIDELEAIFLLDRDVMHCLDDLHRIFPDFDEYTEARRVALVDMRFQLGPAGLRSFRRMIKAIRAHEWDVAARELLDSEYAREQTPGRAEQNARLMLCGRAED